LELVLRRKSRAITVLTSLLLTSPAFAHNEQSTVMEGIIHFMTEPDHLAFSALVAAAVTFAVRKIASKRS
jgi:hydrogenase/urease accessory protein HupE